MVAPWCVGTVTSQVGDQYAVNVILDGGGMGGQIGASGEPGRGAMFWIRIPLPRVSSPAGEIAARAAGGQS